DSGARRLYTLALSSVVIAALLPLFRAVLLSLAVCWIIYARVKGHDRDERGDLDKRSGPADRTGGRRGTDLPGARISAPSTKTTALVMGALAVAVILAWAVLFGAASIKERLASPRNAYGRLATWEAAAKIALENPTAGVGLGNYSDYYSKKYSSTGNTRESILDARAASSPHSNVLWIAAELGLIACVIYVAAHAFIFLMGYRALARARRPEERAAAACYIAIAVGYWIPGLTLTSAAYSDLNMYLFFILGLLLSVAEGARSSGGETAGPDRTARI
ncbi:MAG TPA: O-antigen ligase family protein, partial [Blastocatellia bacterium]|nr:O-antigen ligase family protein [Blastocatellia bacterium]